MSYDISLNDPVTQEIILLAAPHEMRGGTYAVGGTRTATLNVTYNYSGHYRRVFGENGIRSVYGMTGAESIPVLKDAIAQLCNDVDEDYWKATEGNAMRPLLQLLALAQLRPDGVWCGD